jgi:uncharacterized protein
MFYTGLLPRGAKRVILLVADHYPALTISHNHMKGLHAISFILVIIGGLNWGLVGLSQLVNGAMGWNVVNMILGSWPMVEGIVYVLVGLSAIVLAAGHKKDCRACMPGGAM